MRTIYPVTANGWYEHTDGTIGKYMQVRPGVFALVASVSSTADIRESEVRMLAERARRLAMKIHAGEHPAITPELLEEIEIASRTALAGKATLPADARGAN